MNNRDAIYKFDVCKENDPRRIFINCIKNEYACVLDVGCACGDFAKELKNIYPKISIFGVECNPKSIEIARQTCVFEDIWHEDLEILDIKKYGDFFGKFDFISFGDVLEHIKNPLDILLGFKNFLRPGGNILISIPNAAHASIKANLLLDNFDYTDAGILDITHIRFFTYKTVAKLCTDAGLKIEESYYTDWCGIMGTQPNDPYNALPIVVKDFILSNKYSNVCQFVVKTVPDDSITNSKNLTVIQNSIPEFLDKSCTNEKSLTFLQKIFSVTNQKRSNKIYKVIVLFGVKFKFKKNKN